MNFLIVLSTDYNINYGSNAIRGDFASPCSMAFSFTVARPTVITLGTSLRNGQNTIVRKVSTTAFERHGPLCSWAKSGFDQHGHAVNLRSYDAVNYARPQRPWLYGAMLAWNDW